MTRKQKLFFLPAAILFSAILSAQDIHFSQLTETPLLLNPANAALGHNVLAIINYKDQWRSVATPYRTFNVGTDFAVYKRSNESHLGLGLDVFADKAGDGGMGT